MNARRRKLSLAFGIAGALLALLLFGTHFFLKRKVSQWKTRLSADGERFEIKDCLPRRVDARDNSFGEVSRLTSQLVGRTRLHEIAPPSLLQIAPGNAMPVLPLTNWVIRRSAGPKGTTNGTWSVVTAELAAVTNALSDLTAALRGLPSLEANLDYYEGFTLRLVHLSRFKGAAQVLQLAALRDLHAGQRDQALDELCAILALVRGTEKEPLFISQLVRISIAQIAFNITWQFLQSPDWTDAQLARLQESWQRLEFIAAAEAAIVMERAMAIAAAEAYRASHEKFVNDLQAWGGPPTTATNISSVLEQLPERTWQGLQHFVWRWWWSYVDELRMLQIEQVWIESARLARSSGSYAAARSNEVIRLRSLDALRPADLDDLPLFEAPRLQSLLADGARRLQKAPWQAARAETLCNLAVTAVALKRFQQRLGKLPTALGALTPDLIAKVPHDPMDGQALRYRPTANGGILLYSVGEDTKDDQGDPAPTPDSSGTNISWMKGRDWVWPTPASDDEVRSYQEKLEQKAGRRRGD